jgi:fimbrial chaperone protein
MHSNTLALNLFKIIKVVLFSLFFYIYYANLAYAGYSFDKTQLNLSSKQRIDTIKLSNPGIDSIPVSLQVKVVRWTQNKGNDEYQTTKDLVVSPPQLQILPDKTKLVRVGWRSLGPLSQEMAYRLIISDLTPYKKKENAVILKLQINLPVFVEPDNVILKAEWQVKRANNNTLNVLVNNVGNVHIKVSKLTLTNTNNEVIASQPTMFYLLPGQSKQGPVRVTKSPGQSVNIVADTDKGKLNATVNVL